MTTQLETFTHAEGEIINRELRRLISPLSNGKYSLFTYEKESDENYQVVRVDVAAADAKLWVAGQAHAHGLEIRYENGRPHREQSFHLDIKLTQTERQHLLLLLATNGNDHTQRFADTLRELA